MSTTWLSVHIFYAGDLELLLKELVRPLLQTIACPAFFIRYWEGGPHIRLRLSVTSTQAATVKAALTAAAAHFFSAHPSQGNTVANDSLQYIAYEPEIDRYGNRESIRWAEQQFAASSDYVLQELCETPVWTVSNALVHGLRLNITLLYALQENPAFTLLCCQRFIDAWLPRLYDRAKDRAAQEQYFKHLLLVRFGAYAPALTEAAVSLWQALEMDDAAPPLQAFMQRNRAVYRQYRLLGFDGQRMQGIIGSFMHMGHNRLGISNLDEAYIMFFTLKCMEHIYGGMEPAGAA